MLHLTVCLASTLKHMRQCSCGSRSPVQPSCKQRRGQWSQKSRRDMEYAAYVQVHREWRKTSSVRWSAADRSSALDTPAGSARELAGLCVSLLKVADHYAAKLWPGAGSTSSSTAAAAAGARDACTQAQEAAIGAWTAVQFAVPVACTTAKHQKANGQPVSVVRLVGRAVMVLGTYLPTAAGLVQPAAGDARVEDKHIVYAIPEKAMSAVHWLAKELADPQLPGGEAAAAAVAAAAAAGGCSSVAELQQQVEAAWELAYSQLRGLSSYRNGHHVITTAAAVPVPASLAAVAGKLAKQLQVFGLAVAVQFPAAALCCNPGCVNLQGSSEAQLLGPGSRCSGCKVARFCSKECSMAAWKAGHKAVCKRLKAAAASGGPA